MKRKIKVAKGQQSWWKKLTEFIYKLFFTRDDDLDVLQLLFAIIILVTLVVSWIVATSGGEEAVVKVESLVTLRWLAGLLVLTAVPKWLVPFVIKSKVATPFVRDKFVGTSEEEH